MKIVHVNDVASVGTTLVHALTALGHDARLVPLLLAGGSRSGIAKLARVPERVTEMFRVNSEIRRLRPDIVHIHYAYLGTYGRIGRYDYFLHCHGTDVRRGLTSLARRGLTRAAMRSARGVFFSTPDLSDAVRAVRPDAQYLPSPVRTDLFRPMDPVERTHPEILLISSLSPVKGIEIAFGAIENVLRKRTCTVTAIAAGPLAARYRGTPGIRFVDPVPHEQMPGLLAKADIVVGQFLLGSLGLAELESMACGKPVVAYVAPSPFYGKSLPVAGARDIDSATDAIVTLLDDPSRRRSLGREAAAWVARHHDWLHVAEELAHAYRG